MATYQLPNGTTVSDSMSFTHDGIQYPENWIRLSTELDRERIGLSGPLPEPPWYDQQFYRGPDQPKDHAELVKLYCGYVRLNANAQLRNTDWMVIREADNGTVIDPAIKTLREEIRLAAGAKNAAITATTDTAELASYITGPTYPTWPPYADPDSVDAAGDSVSDRVEPSQYGSSDGLIG
jgi:hypothetical protein